MGFGLRQPFPHAVGVLEGVLLAEREGKSSELVLEHMSQGQTILAYQKGCGRMREADVFCGGRPKGYPSIPFMDLFDFPVFV